MIIRSKPQTGRARQHGAPRILEDVGLLRAGHAALVTAFLLFSGGCPGCGRSGSGAEPRHLVLITMDTTRQDHLSCYGHQPVTTPRLDALARRGVVFEKAYASGAVTLTTHATILTGTYPYRHGARDNMMFRVGDANTSLAERLEQAGFTTGAFVAASVLDHRFGLDQGFDHYDDDVAAFAVRPIALACRRGEQITDRALEWARRARDKGPTGARLFIWAHYFDAHLPRDVPPEWLARFDDPYDAEIAYMDAQIGRLLDGLDELGVLSDALVICVADHGEGLGDHREQTHGLFLYDEIVKVPLVMAGPGLPAGRRIGEVVRTADIFPTALDLLGLAPQTGVHGVSLAPWIEGGAPLDLAAYFETYTPHFAFGWSWERGVRLNEPPVKLIDEPRPELYDLAEDPDERLDLSQTNPELLARLERELAAIGNQGPTESLSTPVSSSAKLQARFAALGYTAGSVDETGERGADVKDRIDDFLRKEKAKDLLAAGDPNAALTMARGLLDRVVKKAEVHGLLGACWLAKAHSFRAAGRDEEAARALETAIHHLELGLRERPESAFGRFDLAAVYDMAGRKKEMVEQLELCVQIDASMLPAQFNLSQYYAEQGEYKKALHHLESFEPLWKGTPDEAIIPRSCLLAGVCSQNLGDLEKAYQRIQRARAMAPDWPEPELWLGRLCVVMKRPDEARRHLESFLAQVDAGAKGAAQARRLLEGLTRR